MKFSLVPPHLRRLPRLDLPIHRPIVKMPRVIVQFVSLSLIRKQRTLSGAVPRVGTTCTRTASGSGQGAKPGKRSDVCTGKTALNFAEMTGIFLMQSQPYAMAGRRGITQASQEDWENQRRGIRECSWRVGLIGSSRLRNLSPVLGTT